MPKPTMRALKRKPMAVVLLAFAVKDKTVDLTSPVEAEFEWFETKAGLDEFWDHIKAWNADDVKNHGDLAHVMIEVTDTSGDTLTVGRVQIAPEKIADAAKDAFNGDATKALKDFAKQAQQDPSTWVVLPPAPAKKAVAKKGGVKPRGKNEAAKAVVKDGARKGVRRAAIKRDPAKAEALKKRLADKQVKNDPEGEGRAEAKAERKIDAEVAALDAAVATA